MAENGKKGNPAAKADGATKKPTLYNVFRDNGDALEVVALGHKAKTPTAAVTTLADGNESLNGVKLVVVPVRNYKVFTPEVQTVRKFNVKAG